MSYWVIVALCVSQPEMLPGDVILILQQKEHPIFKRKVTRSLNKVLTVESTVVSESSPRR
eukprot:1720789-Pyramimonas_sp.AAC.3